MTWPATNPSSNANGGLLASLALARGITNFSTLPWQAQVEALLANLLSDLPPAINFSTMGRTIGAMGTTQNSTPSAANLLGGIVTQTGATGAGTATLPIGTLLSAACPVTPAVGASFQCLFMNVGGGQTITITGDTGTTVSGTAAVPTAKACLMTFVNTGAGTWNCYCNLSA